MLNQELLTVLLIALAVNTVVAVSLVVWPVYRRRSQRGPAADPLGASSATGRSRGPTADAGEDQDRIPLEAGEPWFLTSSTAAAARGERAWAPDHGVAGGPVAGDAAAADPAASTSPAMPPMATSAEWETWLDDEAVRIVRYQRPATIVLIELAGLDRLAERVGQLAADRLVPPIAATIRRHARESDRLARLAEARFGVLLVETDEVSAINYVERIRSACDVWLAAGAVNLRLSVGWAEIRDSGRDGAMRQAEQRLFDDRRRTMPVEVIAEPGPRDDRTTLLQATGS